MTDVPSSGPQISRMGVWGAALATIAVYFGFVLAWRADRPEIVTPPDSAIATAVQADLYALQARGFLKGQLHLDLDPPPALAAAAHPYDPAQRPPVLYLHDSSLFRGRYYMYFGPAPALLLFAPWKLITGDDLPTPYAVGIFASLAYLSLLALFRSIVRTCYPEASRLAQWAGILALGGATMLLPLVRRPAVYEVAIACGCAASGWGLYCAWRSRVSARPLPWAAACGTLFGIAVAARPTFGLGALGAALVMSLGSETRGGRLLSGKRLMTAAICGAVFVFGLLAYNHARFGEALEFGQKYQLSSAEEGAIQHFSPRFVPTQAWFYFLAPLRFSGYFPFFSEAAEPTLPAGFGAHEHSFGVLANLPLAWFAAVALAGIGRAGGSRALLAALALGSLAAAAPLLFFFGSCVRYQAEFTPPLMLLAICGLLEAETRSPHFRRWISRGAFALASLSVAVALLASVDMYNASDGMPPRGFDPIGRVLNAPRVNWDAAWGQSHGTLHLRLRAGDSIGQRETLVLSRGPNGARETLEYERLDPARLRLFVRRTGPDSFEDATVVESAPDATHAVTVSLSSFYPLRPIEMATAVSRETFRALKIWTRVDWDGRRVIDKPAPALRWRAEQIVIAPGEPGEGAERFSGELLAREWRDAQEPARREPMEGVRLRLAVTPELQGRSFPLGVTGHPGRGNFLFVRFPKPGEIQFGYDHWGKPVIMSDPIPFVASETHLIDFWMPSVIATATAGPLIVEIDGRRAWSVPVPYYPAGAQEVFIARNPLGGSACEPEFPGAVIENTRLPLR